MWGRAWRRGMTADSDVPDRIGDGFPMEDVLESLHGQLGMERMLVRLGW